MEKNHWTLEEWYHGHFIMAFLLAGKIAFEHMFGKRFTVSIYEYIYIYIYPPWKPTYPLKIDGRCNVLLKWSPIQGTHVNFRKCIYIYMYIYIYLILIYCIPWAPKTYMLRGFLWPMTRNLGDQTFILSWVWGLMVYDVYIIRYHHWLPPPPPFYHTMFFFAQRLILRTSRWEVRCLFGGAGSGKEGSP